MADVISPRMSVFTSEDLVVSDEKGRFLSVPSGSIGKVESVLRKGREIWVEVHIYPYGTFRLRGSQAESLRRAPHFQDTSRNLA